MNLRALWPIALVFLLFGCSTGNSVVGGDSGGDTSNTVDADDATPRDGSMDVPAVCTPAETMCGSRCVDTRNDSANCGACGTTCGATLMCVAGVCQVSCPGTQTACSGACVDLATDGRNCGACGRACGTGEVCSLSRCSFTCAATLATCGGGDAGAGDASVPSYCADTRTDRANCGACGNVCPVGNVCMDGMCQVSCPGTQTACGGSCANLQTDNANCGSCGTVCGAGQACTNGACAASCGTGLSVCGTTCANLQTDNANCGTCGTVCTAGRVCSGGVCGTTCAAPLVTCGAGDAGMTSCADLTIDPANCGACGTVCTLANVATTGCTAGACSIVRCATGFGDCNGVAADGCETDLGTSASHCGACGAACALPNVTAQACMAGACTVPTGSCATGFADCNGAASDGCETSTRTDNANCGNCGTTCAPGQLCSGGVCGATCGAGLSTCGSGTTAFCTNTQIDPTNCGACGTVCALPGAAANGCAGGACTVIRCNAGAGDCNGLAADGCEADLQTSAASCGACGRACSLPNAAAACTAGACGVAACNAGFADCDGVAANGCEVDVRTDNTNCGACATNCPAGQVCSSGRCGTTCAAGLTTCAAAGSAPPFCANVAVDPDNCGICGQVCALPAASLNGCSGGTCTVIRCNAGAGDCNGIAVDGCETNLQTSATNCGACGRACTLANASSACSGGTCGLTACSAGFANCDGATANGCEVNTRTDNANCGGCGVACAAGQVCSGGVCGTTCAASLTTCPAVGGVPSYCANTQVDPANCGTCGRVCALPGAAASGCAAGACTVIRCNTGVADCNGTAADGCETNVLTSAANCGACGRACSLPNASSACAAGACGLTACSAGFANCDGIAATGCEVDTRSDNANCGGCGVACGAGQSCTAGVCVTTCASPNVVCGSGATAFCTDTRIDPRNCGGCGTVCALANTSVNGCGASACTVVTCNAGFGNCDGVATNGCETNLATTATSCGACGRACVLANATSSCTAGACAVTACTAGFANCDMAAANGCEANTNTDPANCGGCGRACGTGQVCVAGVCGSACLAPNTACMGSVAVCTNTTIDPANCGMCGRVCSLPNTSVEGCVAGACTVVGCVAGFANCDSMAANGCETGITSDANNCGACGRVCPSGQQCTAGSCVPNPLDQGCADGTREGYLSLTSYPRIAACAGGFQIPGVLSSTFAPACSRGGGNNGSRPTGVGCNVADLCAVGWHVCYSSAEVTARSTTGCTNASPSAGMFFTTRQSSTGCGVCATGTNFLNPPCNSSSCSTGCGGSDAVSNDFFGCGSVGAAPAASCAPLSAFSNDVCSSLPAGWSCGTDGFREAHNVVLTTPAAGGALCCRD